MLTLLCAAALSLHVPSNAQSETKTEVCTAKNAKTVSFKKAGRLASETGEICIRIKGYVYSHALHRTKAVALSKAEPDWQTIGFGGDSQDEEPDPRQIPDKPRLAMITGYLRDCGSKSWPAYCHYVGGPIIRVEQIKFLDK